MHDGLVLIDCAGDRGVCLAGVVDMKWIVETYGRIEITEKEGESLTGKAVGIAEVFGAGGGGSHSVLEPAKSLRDEFAMAALTGILARPLSADDGYDLLSYQAIVGVAYQIAEEMMRQRKHGS